MPNSVRTVSRHSLALVLIAQIVALALFAVPASARSRTTVQIYASGLINPKGLAFTRDRTLYVAESGKPGAVTVPLPVNFGGKGPIGTNARVSRIRLGGRREDFITGLPNIGLYGGIEMLGAAGVAVLHGQLYELAAGHMTVSPRLSRVAPNGRMTAVADVGAFGKAHPPPSDNGDAVPMGNPFALVPLQNNLYFTDGNYNRLLKATPQGKISILASFANDPTTVGAAAAPDGTIYVCQFSPAPYTRGTGRIDRVSLGGKITTGVVRHLTMPIAVSFAPDGTMYVLQYASNFSVARRHYLPFGGQVLRVNRDGTFSAIVTHLVFPTAMTFGPDGALYVTNYGNESNGGQGQVLRIVPGDSPGIGPAVPPPDDARSYKPTTSVAAPTGAEAAVGARVSIREPADVQKWGYSPSPVTIHVGQSVIFTNSAPVAHTATSSQGVFDTGLIQPGRTATVVFRKPGTYTYYCQPHPWMRGKVIVRGVASATAAPARAIPATRDTAENQQPPTINPWKAGGIIGLVVLGVLVLNLTLGPRFHGPTE